MVAITYYSAFRGIFPLGVLSTPWVIGSTHVLQAGILIIHSSSRDIFKARLVVLGETRC